MNKTIPDTDLLQGLQEGDSEVIQEIYRLYAGRIRQWVLANSGTVEEAKDVFQEGLQVLFELSVEENFKLQSSFEGLLFTICKRNWYAVLRKKKKWQAIRKSPELTHEEVEADMESLLIKIEENASRASLLSSTFKQLSDLCQQLLTLYAQGGSPDEIAVVLQMSGRNAVYQRRKACGDRWKALMKSKA
ncbi:MAG: sigma-70 family RNA polymerase sigma factor [Bacteroidetes bacterium]|nr:sigma-70 family RNA polymerase sigma factor [Bacteroidota bacterium]